MGNTPFIIIAIDGGAAAGKSSTSNGLSKRFNLMHVDTGSFYRAVTLKLLDTQVPAIEGSQLEIGLESLKLGTAIEDKKASISINDWIPDQSIRSERVNKNVSQYAALPTLRKFLLDYQREQAIVAKKYDFDGLVMEGRDIGSIIFPDAHLKLFLFADPEKRAARRAKEGIVDSIEKRDAQDSQRKSAPLTRPDGSILIDSSEMTLEEVIQHASTLVEKTIKTID
ncbi:(d)CMP kinase [Puniceicoccaceae bacterium K14]|nr:(d)CMP kinase [Puniceicoccaceae bacterium K14]